MIDFYKLENEIKTLEKEYTDQYLPNNCVAFLRLDGRSFSRWTNRYQSFSEPVYEAFAHAAKELCTDIQCAKLAYGQSDEVTIVINDQSSDTTQHWFGGKIHKINSVASSVFTFHFNDFINDSLPALFDCRTFVVPNDKVIDSLVWRQQDARRNAISMLAQEHFSDRELNSKSTGQRMDMMREKGIMFNDLQPQFRKGFTAITKEIEYENEYGTYTRNQWSIDNDIPYFHEDEEYVLSKVFDD